MAGRYHFHELVREHARAKAATELSVDDGALRALDVPGAEVRIQAAV
jgi:hypothetical protein